MSRAVPLVPMRGGAKRPPPGRTVLRQSRHPETQDDLR